MGYYNSLKITVYSREVEVHSDTFHWQMVALSFTY